MAIAVRLRQRLMRSFLQDGLDFRPLGLHVGEPERVRAFLRDHDEIHAIR